LQIAILNVVLVPRVGAENVTITTPLSDFAETFSLVFVQQHARTKGGRAVRPDSRHGTGTMMRFRLLARAIDLFLPGSGRMMRNFRLLAIDYGQWRSVRERVAVDANGGAVPWYTYPAIEYLSSFDFRDCDVFEFGSGNSSLFWASRARSVVSVEIDNEWFEAIDRKKESNQCLLYRPDAPGYVNALAEQGRPFDVIVIDGNWRDQCAQAAPRHLRAGGMIVLDNSDRILEQECATVLRAQGFIQVDFSGFGPINGFTWTTSVFLKTPDLQHNFRGPSPIGGLQE
jgi:hypothetical protein